MGGDKHLPQAEGSACQILIWHIIDIPQYIFSLFNPVQVVCIIVNFQSAVPTPRNKQILCVVILQQRNLVPMAAVFLNDQATKKV